MTSRWPTHCFPTRAPLASFLLAFVLVTYQWRLHHRTFHGLQSFSPRLLTINAWWLAAVVFLPFPTEWVGRDNINPRVVSFMWVCQGAVGLIGLGLWFYLRRHPELTGGLMSARPQDRPGCSQRSTATCSCWRSSTARYR